VRIGRCRQQSRWQRVIALAAVVLCLVRGVVAEAGSSEPKLAIAEVSAVQDGDIVTLEVVGNFDYGNYVRLGYPVAIVVTEGTTVARLGLDGSINGETAGVPWTSSRGDADPTVPRSPGGPGVIAIAPDRLTAVFPPELIANGVAVVQLEANFTFEGTTWLLHSNSVEVSW